MIRRALLVTAAAASLLLHGCADDQDELLQWMEQQKREVRPSVEPLTAPKKFIPQAYVALSNVEPFSSQKLTVALKQEARQPNSLLAAEINRRKEALEAYPIDSMARESPTFDPLLLQQFENALSRTSIMTESVLSCRCRTRWRSCATSFPSVIHCTERPLRLSLKRASLPSPRSSI